MGVIHKLKTEVIAFILEKQKESPLLGCRNLAEIVSQHFQTKISKSSVNIVLQQAQLSPPVGRRPAKGTSLPIDKPTRKFSIPEHRKTQIFPKGMLLSGAIPDGMLEKGAGEEKQSVDIVKRPAKEIFQETSSLKIKKSISQEKTLSVKLERLDGLGAIFLKAAEWDLSDEPIFEGLLRKAGLEKFDAEEQAACQVLSFMQLFGINKVEDLEKYHPNSLWKIHHFEKGLPYEKILNFIKRTSHLRNLNVVFSVDIPMLFSQVKYYTICLEKGEEIKLDAPLFGFYCGNVQSELLPINKSMRFVVNIFMNNVQSVILNNASSPPNEDSFFPQDLTYLIQGLEGHPNKQIKKVILNDPFDQPIASFENILPLKRFLITAVWPWERVFKRIQESMLKKKKVRMFVDGIDKKVDYQEAMMAFSSDARKDEAFTLRVFLIQDPVNDSQSIGLITNASEVEMSSSEAISAYFQRWPNFAESPAIMQAHSSCCKAPDSAYGFKKDDNITTDLFSNSYDIYDISKNYVRMLHQYSQHAFFPDSCWSLDFETMRKMFYSLGGGLSEEKRFIRVRLEPSPNSQYLKELEFVIRKINESQVCDPSNRQLILS